MYNYSTAVELTETKMNKLQKPIDIEVTTLNAWDKQEEEFIDIATPLIKEMVQYLSPVPTITEMAKDSVGDQVAKIDLIFEYPEVKSIDEKTGEEYVASPHRIVGFQVKSSEYMAKLHMEKNKDGVYYDGVHWPCPGVFWCSEISLTTTVALANFTGGCVNPEIDKAIEDITKLRATATKGVQGYYHNAKLLKKFFNDFQWRALQDLKIVMLAGGRMFYVDS